MNMKHFGRPWAWSAGLVVATMLCSQPAFGQQDQDRNAPAKFQDVTWYSVTEYAFKPGNIDDAMNLATKFIIPADEAAGEHVMVLIHDTGPWNVTVIGSGDAPLFSALERKKASAGDVAFHEAFVKLAGSEANEIDKQFGSYIDHVDRYIAHSPKIPPSGGK